MPGYVKLLDELMSSASGDDNSHLASEKYEELGRIDRDTSTNSNLMILCSDQGRNLFAIENFVSVYRLWLG